MKWPWQQSQFERDATGLLIAIRDNLMAKDKTLAQLNNKLDNIQMEVSKMGTANEALMANIQSLIADVTAEGNAVTAATAAIKGLTDQQAVLTQQLQDAIAAGDPVAIQAAADAIGAQNDAIVAQTAALAAAIPAVPAT
jgi:uncharacterized protein YoxC